MNIDFGPDNSEGGKYLASATSLSARIPAFDYVSHNDMAYLKIKSNEFVFARSSTNENDQDSSIVIIPTDDPRIKAVIIPSDCLTQQSQSQTLNEQITATLASL